MIANEKAGIMADPQPGDQPIGTWADKVHHEAKKKTTGK